MLRQMAFERRQGVDPLAQAVDAIFLAACDSDHPARRDALDGFSDAQLILPAMPTGEHQSHIVTLAFRPRRHAMAGRLQGAKIRPEALYEMQRRIETSG